MKIRSGFVSNSSSSSFLVAFDKRPKTSKKLQEMMFNKIEERKDPYDDKKFYKTNEIAEQVFKDLKKQKPTTLKKAIEAVSCSWFSTRPKFENYRIDKKANDEGLKNYDMKAFNKDLLYKSTKVAEDFFEENKGKKIYIFTYSDKDGDFFIFMEHGNIFKKLEHLRLSHH